MCKNPDSWAPSFTVSFKTDNSWEKSQKLAATGEEQNILEVLIPQLERLEELDFEKLMERLTQHKYYIYSTLLPKGSGNIKNHWWNHLSISCFLGRKPSILWIYTLLFYNKIGSLTRQRRQLSLKEINLASYTSRRLP